MKKLYLTDAGVEPWERANRFRSLKEKILDSIGELEGECTRYDFTIRGSLGRDICWIVIDELIEEGLVEER